MVPSLNPLLSRSPLDQPLALTVIPNWSSSSASLLTHHVLHSYVHPFVSLPQTISLPRFPTYQSHPPQLCTPLGLAPPRPYPSPASLLTHHTLHSYVHPFVSLPQTISLPRFPTYQSHPPQLCTPLRLAPPRPYPSPASLLTHHIRHSYVHPFVSLPPDHIPPPLPYLPITSSTVMYTPSSRSPRPYPSPASLLTHHTLHSYVHPLVSLPPDHIPPPLPYLPITPSTVMYTPSSRSPRPYPSPASLLTNHIRHSYVHPFVSLPPDHIPPPLPYLPITSSTVMYTPSSRSPRPYPSPASLLTHHVLHSYVHPFVSLPQTISLPRFPTYQSHPPQLCTPLRLAPPRPYPSPASLLTHHVLHSYVHPFVSLPQTISLPRFPTYPSHPPQLCTPLRLAPPDHIPPPLPYLPITSATVMYTPSSRSPQTISLPRFPTYPSHLPQLCTPLRLAPPDHIPPPLPYLPITSSTVMYTPSSRSPRPYPSPASLLTNHILHSYVHPFVSLPQTISLPRFPTYPSRPPQLCTPLRLAPPDHIPPPLPYLPITSATVMYTPSSRSPRPYPSPASLLTHHIRHSYVHPLVLLPPDHIPLPLPYLPITPSTVMYTPWSCSPQTISLPRFPTYPSRPPQLCTPLGLAPPRPYPSSASLLTHHIRHSYVHPLVSLPPDHIPPPLPYLPITPSTVMYTPWSRSPQTISLLRFPTYPSHPPQLCTPLGHAPPRPYPSPASLLTHHVRHSYVHPLVSLPPDHIPPPLPYLPITSATVMYTPWSRSPQTISLLRFPTYPSHLPQLCTPLGLAPPRPYPSSASLLTHHIRHSYVHPLVMLPPDHIPPPLPYLPITSATVMYTPWSRSPQTISLLRFPTYPSRPPRLCTPLGLCS